MEQYMLWTGAIFEALELKEAWVYDVACCALQRYVSRPWPLDVLTCFVVVFVRPRGRKE